MFKKVLTFRPGSIGDALMGKYFLENIRAQHPGARLGIVVGEKAAMLRDLFAAESWIDVVEASRKNPVSLFRLLWQWRGSDAVLTYYTAGTLNLSTKLMARLLAKRGGLVGFRDRSSLTPYIYDHLFPLPVPSRAVRSYEDDALKVLDIPATAPMYLHYVPMPGIAEKFGIKKPYVVAQLFSSTTRKGLSNAKIRELLGVMGREMPGVTVVLLGSHKDVNDAKTLSADFPHVLSIAGRATLQESINLMAESAAVVSLDTGIGHLAAHIGRPPIILSTCLGYISWWGPQQYPAGTPAALFCRPDLCPHGHIHKPYPDCLGEVDMQEVAVKTKQLLRV